MEMNDKPTKKRQKMKTKDTAKQFYDQGFRDGVKYSKKQPKLKLNKYQKKALPILKWLLDPKAKGTGRSTVIAIAVSQFLKEHKTTLDEEILNKGFAVSGLRHIGVEAFLAKRLDDDEIQSFS